MEKSELHCNLALLIKEFSQLSSISININYAAWVKVCLAFLLYVMIKICTCVTIITVGGNVYTGAGVYDDGGGEYGAVGEEPE